MREDERNGVQRIFQQQQAALRAVGIPPEQVYFVDSEQKAQALMKERMYPKPENNMAVIVYAGEKPTRIVIQHKGKINLVEQPELFGIKTFVEAVQFIATGAYPNQKKQ